MYQFFIIKSYKGGYTTNWYYKNVISNVILFDFNSNTTIYIYPDSLSLIAPIPLLENAVFLNRTIAQGSGRKKRDIGNKDESTSVKSCESICEAMNKPNYESKTNLIINLANQMYANCVDDCNKNQKNVSD